MRSEKLQITGTGRQMRRSRQKAARSVLLLPGFVLTTLALWLAGCGATERAVPPPFAELEDRRMMGSAELSAALTAPDPDWRRQAARVVGRLQDPAQASALAAAALAETDIEVLQAQLFALGQLGLARGAEPANEAVSAVQKWLASEDPQVAATAVEALGKLAPSGAAEPLVSQLQHPAAEVRVEAAHALMRQRFVPVWRRQAAAPPPLPVAAVEALATALDDPSPDVRYAAAHALSRYGEVQAAAALAAALGDADERVRLFAARALGRAGDLSQAEALDSVLSDPSAAVRREAVVAAAALAGFESLAELHADSAVAVRVAVATALGSGSREQELPTLRQLEQDPSLSVRRAAIASLAQRLGAGYADELRALLGTEDPWQRAAAARSLQFAGDAGRELLETAIGDADRRVQTAAVEAAAVLDDSGQWLEWALEQEDLAVRGTAVNSLGGATLPETLAERRLELLDQAYQGSAGEAWIEVREGVVDALAAVPGGEALLRRLASDDPASSVRRAAAVALAAQGIAVEPPASPAIEPSPFLGTDFPTPVPRVILETDRGEIEIITLPEAAPIHVANFLDLVEKGYYDGLLWHRVAPNFVIQGGDPRGDGWGGPGYTLRDEISRERFERGTVGMPKAGKDTGGGQIFITHVPTPHLDGNYTIFGRVVRGLEVIDQVEVGDAIRRAWVVD